MPGTPRNKKINGINMPADDESVSSHCLTSEESDQEAHFMLSKQSVRRSSVTLNNMLKRNNFGGKNKNIFSNKNDSSTE